MSLLRGVSWHDSKPVPGSAFKRHFLGLAMHIYNKGHL
jgi:hypothetical protein